MTRPAAQFIAIGFFVVLFGQLGFKALAYHFGISHPSWVFWIALYSLLAVQGIHRFCLWRPGMPDQLFIAGMLYAVGNYAILGQADLLQFVGALTTIWLGPYLIGRFFARLIRPHTPAVIFGIAAITIVLVVWQIVIKPEVINNDRLILFAPNNWDGVGGDGTMAYIGNAVGAACMVGFVRIRSKVAQMTLTPTFYALLMTVGLLEVFMLFFGSRSALIAVLLSCTLLTLFQGRKNLARNYGILLFLIAIPLLAYPVLSSPRATLVSQMVEPPFSLKKETNTEHDCNLSGNSVSARHILFAEAARMFLEHPVFGVGAGNFGLFYCGPKSEFASPHNMQAHLLTEYGLIGALPWLLLFLFILYRLMKMLQTSGTQIDEASLCIISLWLFTVAIAQISGNVYIDFNVFMLTGAAVAVLHPLPLGRAGMAQAPDAPLPSCTAEHSQPCRTDKTDGILHPS